MIARGETFLFGSEYPDLIEPIFCDSSVAIRRDVYPLIVSSLPGSKPMIRINALAADQEPRGEFGLVARCAPCHGVIELHSESAGGSDPFSPESI